jgi:hypothetical protein
MRLRPVLQVLPPLVLLLPLGDCSKARGDDFSRFRGAEALITPGAAPRRNLRYRPTPGRDAVYQLVATRTTDAKRPRARMRLRVALTFPPDGQATAFKLRLLSLLRLEPEPPMGAPELGPTHVLLQGALGPRGSLDRLEESAEVMTPVNLTLLAPLLLPTYPDAAVGVGGAWRVSRKLTWGRQQAADRLLARTGSFDGRSTVLLTTQHKLIKEQTVGDLAQVVLEGQVEARLRSRTATLSHVTHHDGTAQGSVQTTVDRTTGLPESVRVSLKGRYSLRANDRTRTVEEAIEVTLTRER